MAATLRISRTDLDATPENVSPEGIFVSLLPGVSADLAIGTLVEVEISSGEATLQLHGVIRSRRSNGYGIFFPKRTEEGFVNPLHGLARIHAELQREFLSTRILVKSDLEDDR